MSQYVSHEQVEELLQKVDGLLGELERNPPEVVGYEFPVRVANLAAQKLILLAAYETSIRVNALESSFEKFRLWVGEAAARQVALNSTPREEVRAREALSKISSLVEQASAAGAFNEKLNDDQAQQARRWLQKELRGIIEEGTGVG